MAEAINARSEKYNGIEAEKQRGKETRKEIEKRKERRKEEEREIYAFLCACYNRIEKRPRESAKNIN